MSGTSSRAKLLVFIVLLLTLNTKLSADELGNAFKQLGLKGEISDGSFFGRYIEWRPPEKHASREQVIFYDADGNQHPFILYRIKPDSRYAGQIRPATFLIGEKQYISLAHALASAKPGSTIEVSPGYFSLPPVHTAPNLESLDFFHRFTSVWTSDDYAEFYLVPKETWVAFGSLSGITLRGSQGQSVSINPLAAVTLKNLPRQPDTQKRDNTGEEKNTDKSTSEGGERKGRFLGRLREGVAKLNLGDVQEGSILGMIQGGGSYPPLKHVLARWDAYMLPKVDYQSEEESVLISRPGSQFNRLGQGHKAKCPNWVHCIDYAVANPLVISNSQDVTIENIDFAGPETSSFMGEGNGSALSLIAPMVAVMDSENVTFRNCTFSNAPGVGVLLRRSRRVTFENCVFLHSAEESIVATDTDVSIINSIFLGNGRGKAIEHRVVTGDAVGEDIAPDSKYVQTTIEKFPQSAAIRLEQSFAFASNSLFKFSGTGAIDGDCRSELALVGNAFDEVTGPAVIIGTEAKKFEGNIIRGSVVCRDQLATQCEAVQAALRGNNSFTDKAVSIEDVTMRFGTRVTEREWRPLSIKYWESAGGRRAACTQGPSVVKYFLQMAFACREGWNGVLPDLTYFNLGSEDDRSALALGYAGCAALAKTVESGAKAAYELRSAGYTAAIRIHLYKEGILFREPLKDFPLELTFEGRSISKFKTGDGGIFGDGSGFATVNFLKPGKYEIKSPLTDSVSVVLEDGLTTEVSLELK